LHLPLLGLALSGYSNGFVLGAEYRAALPVFLITASVLSLTLFLGLATMLVHTMMKPQIDAWVNVGRLGIMIIMAFFLIPPFQVLGAAIAYAVPLLIGEMWMFRYVLEIQKDLIKRTTKEVNYMLNTKIIIQSFFLSVLLCMLVLLYFMALINIRDILILMIITFGIWPIIRSFSTDNRDVLSPKILLPFTYTLYALGPLSLSTDFHKIFLYIIFFFNLLACFLYALAYIVVLETRIWIVS
jgi:hypothetical protein